jgi:hypothetical protein
MNFRETLGKIGRVGMSEKALPSFIHAYHMNTFIMYNPPSVLLCNTTTKNMTEN